MGLGNELTFETQWMDKLADSIDRHARRDIREAVMEGSDAIGEASDRSAVIEWTAGAMSRLEFLVDGNAVHDVLTGCACRYPERRLVHLRDTYRETADLRKVHGMLQEQFLAEIRPSKQLQDEHIRFIVENDMGMAGRLDGDTIVATKIPKDFLAHYESCDEEERRFLYCHCPRVRQALKAPATRIPDSYCLCGAGYYRAIWEYVLERPVRVEVLESVLAGGEVCRIAVRLTAE